MEKKRLPGEPKRPLPPQLVGKTLRDRPQDINRKGRPKDFDQLRSLVQELLGEKITVRKGGQSTKLTRLENLILEMIAAKQAAEHTTVLQYGFGKVPDTVDITSKGESIVLPPEKVAERVIQLLELAKQRKEEQDEKS